MSPSVEVCRATRRFGDFVAVDSVDLNVEAGEIVGLLGANGAGKTTLIRMLLGLLTPTSGRLTLFGAAPSRETRARLGYVPQHLGLYPDLTVAENLRFSAHAFGSPPSPALAGELASVRDELIGTVPLGVQRRAAFAAALAHRPDLLVLDEPTSGVDPLARARLWDDVRRAAAAGAGALVTTHYMDEARQCDRLVLMAKGHVVGAGREHDIVDGRTTVEVEAGDRWAEVFDVLDAAALPVTLAGRRVRVPGAERCAVVATLTGASIDVPVRTVSSTLEEAMVLVEKAMRV